MRNLHGGGGWRRLRHPIRGCPRGRARGRFEGGAGGAERGFAGGFPGGVGGFGGGGAGFEDRAFLWGSRVRVVVS